MHRMINRYILKEIALPFGMILLVLTFVLLMGKILQLMDLMINKGVRFTDIALLMLYLMPSFLMFTLPISLLIAILIGLGRLSGDNEITVLKMSGLSLYQLSIPVAGAALAAFLMTAVTTLFLVPYGNLASRNLLYDMAKQKASIGIREKVFIDDFRGILLYAEKIPSQRRLSRRGAHLGQPDQPRTEHHHRPQGPSHLGSRYAGHHPEAGGRQHPYGGQRVEPLPEDGFPLL